MTEVELLNIHEAATYTGYSTSWLYRLRQEGRGPLSWKEGTKIMYPASGLDLWLARLRESSRRGGQL